MKTGCMKFASNEKSLHTFDVRLWIIVKQYEILNLADSVVYSWGAG